MFNVTDPRTVAAVRLYVKLARASRAVAACTEPRLAELGITHTQLGVLEALLHLGPLTQRVLIQKVLTSPGNMTDLIDKLEERGFVTRCRVAADKRSVEVGLTEAGRDFIGCLFPRHAGDIAAAMAGLTDAEITTLDELLRRVGTAAASCNGGQTD
ncbi:MAG: MarR family transcriptional regulator [Acidocella sp. 20-57-95]|nr:MAG: MarR family transcriptional regulator [Acidocella sp. 20-57-95]OYV59063.1 MAG: MarR family transcriptional regulator [Acidocella sp. 21-58-7]